MQIDADARLDELGIFRTNMENWVIRKFQSPVGQNYIGYIFENI